MPFPATVAYVQLYRGLALKTVYPWDMRTATVERTADGIIVGDFSDVFSKEGRPPGIQSIRGYRSDEIRTLASENGDVTFNTFEGSIALDAKTLVTSDMGEDTETWYYLYSWPDQPGVYQLLQVNQTALARDIVLAGFKKTVLITAGLTLALAGVVGFFLVWRLLRPLQSITQAARGIGGHDMSRRVKVDGGGEIGELASTLNRMFDRVETAVDTERQVASELSHELRTPLAVMQAEATQALRKERGDQAYQKALETVTREISHMSSIAERLLFLARSEHGGELSMVDVDLRGLLIEAGWDAEVLCEEKGISFQSDLPDSPDRLVVKGDRVRLRELFLNLLNNAVRYTPTGGKITLSLSSDDRFAIVALSDTGIGIAREHLPHIFERFYRVDKEDDGVGWGLGLAICKRIAELARRQDRGSKRGGQGKHVYRAYPVTQ